MTTASWRATLEAANVIAIVLDREYRLVERTSAAAEMLQLEAAHHGLLADELEAAGLLYRGFTRDVRALDAARVSFQREATLESGLGVLVRLGYARDGHDDFDGIIASFVDISELLERNAVLAAALKEVEDYKLALDRSSIVSMTDPRGRITYANERFCETSGYSRAELIGRDHRIVNSGYHPPAFFKRLWATINAGEVWKGELRNRTKDGRLYWVDTTIVPFVDEDGRPQRHVAIRTDITERVRAREELEQSEKQFRRLFENAPVGIAIETTDERVVAVNPALARLLGREFKSLSGCELTDFAVGEAEAARVKHESIRRALLDGTRQSYTYGCQMRRADASVVSTRVTTWVNPPVNGGDVYLIHMFQDITREREAAEQLKAQAALAQLGRMAAVVAHEVKNPLAGIGGALHIIRDRLDEGAFERVIIDEIRDRLGGLNSLVDGLVKFARPVNLERGRVELLPLLERAVTIVGEERLGPGRVEFRPTATGEGELECEIFGDSRLLEQLVVHLLRNAGRAVQPGGGVVELAARCGGEVCTLRVTDNGPGLDDETREHIFDPFFTIKNQGIGLGLAQSRRIARAHGGELDVESSSSEGTTMLVTLPRSPRTGAARGGA